MRRRGRRSGATSQNISIKVIGELNREYRLAMVHKLRERGGPLEAQ